MKESEYIKIFRLSWGMVGLGLIFLFLRVSFELGLALTIFGFIFGGIAAIYRLEYDDNYISDTESII